MIKKLMGYNNLYGAIKNGFFYKTYKQLNGKIANLLYGYPSKDFFIIGVTGTNGKTTTVNLIHKILNENLGKTIMISTANMKIGEKEFENNKKMTSLDIYDLMALLETAKNEGCKIAVLETSSHGLEQSRFEGIDFDLAVLTNITHDHLDYHGTMEKYADAKEKLFKYVLHNHKQNKYAVFPGDDKIGRKWFEQMSFDNKINFCIDNSGILKAENIKENFNGTEFEIIYMGKKYAVKTPLLGKFNVYNILAALSVGLEIGIGLEKIITSIEGFKGISGRMEYFENKGIHYFVNFAHSPDALENILRYLKDIKGNGRLITIFGAPGNRDKFKRPIMGEIVEQYADIAIATDDDPDSENRLSILKQLTEKINKKTLGKDFFILPERSFAIKFALKIAKPGDILVFTGKGHETVQLTNYGKRIRNDKTEILNNLKSD
ncbi:MAG: UDP-N-acetylmuramoyl-L-alanyl-D-glutamate--2,6-diaminopimelate ligase [Candidatus Absconditabacterales bacterium]